jgi:hypothetical protein
MRDNARPERVVHVTVTVRFPGAPRSAELVEHPGPGRERPRHAADGDGKRDIGQEGFGRGLAVGCALGQHLEALRWAAELERWRRLVRWTARQRDAA